MARVRVISGLVQTGTALKTLVQFQTPANQGALLERGQGVISFQAAADGQPIVVRIVQSDIKTTNATTVGTLAAQDPTDGRSFSAAAYKNYSAEPSGKITLEEYAIPNRGVLFFPMNDTKIPVGKAISVEVLAPADTPAYVSMFPDSN